jgi:hypothetical protein
MKTIAKDLLNKAKAGVGVIDNYAYVAKNIIKNALNQPKLREISIISQDIEKVPTANRKKYVEVGKLLDDKKISADEGGNLYSILKSGKDVLLEPYYVRKNKNTSNFSWEPWQTENNMKKYYNIPRVTK